MSLISIISRSNITFCFSQNQTTYSVACLVTAWLVIIVEGYDITVVETEEDLVARITIAASIIADMPGIFERTRKPMVRRCTVQRA